MPTPILIIHGGAGDRAFRPDKREEVAASLERILRKVYPMLKKGGSSLDAVIAATQELEDDPLYNAGKGSKIQSDGKIRLSASVMDGDRKKFAGCVGVERVKNPIRLAEALLGENDRVLAEKGGERFAREAGLRFASAATPERIAEFARKKKGKTGTVGAVALDRRGRLSAATSTGGKGFEYPHRVSDSPTVAGNFANSFCAVSATGIGEEIMDFATAATVAAWCEAGASLAESVQKILKNARRSNARFGLIAVDRRGAIFAGTTTAHLTWASAGSSRRGEMTLSVHP